MVDRVAGQRKTLIYLIENIDDHKIIKPEVSSEKLYDEVYKANLKLLNRLPPLIEKFFSEPIKKLLSTDVKSLNYQYRVVWFGLYLKSIYLGQDTSILLPGHWEDEVDLYDGCCNMLKSLE